MGILDEYISRHQLQDSALPTDDSYSVDKKRAAILADEARLVEELLNLDSLDDNVKAMLSVNLSTSAASKDRPAPSYRDKVQALWDYWKFLDIINFHGGPAAFSECHREVTGWKFRPEAKLRQLILEPRGHLKAQSVETPILTTKGWKTFGDIAVGDRVYHPEGITEVTHTHPITDMELYRVTFSDGRSTLCNKEHLWQVYCPSNWKDVPKVLPLFEIQKNYLSPRYDKRYDRHFLESRYYTLPAAVKMPEAALPIDPYTFGAWLGDGHSDSSRITSADPELIGYLEGTWEHKGRYLYACTHQFMQTKLRNLGVLGNKHIPDTYKYSSVKQRTALLQGLMDTDGTCSTNTSITTSSARLKDDIVWLVRSLGGIATYIYVDSVAAFYITVKVKFNPFKLKRKAVRWRCKREPRLYIKSIKLESYGPGRCITVKAEDGLYLTDKSFIVTHNSTLMCVGYTLWRVYQNPNIRIFVGTEGLKLSKAFIREVEDYLVDDFNVKHIWNDRPHFAGPLIPAMDSLGKQRRLVKDVADEFGEKMPGGSDRKKVWRAEALQVIRPRAMKEPTITAGSVGQQNTGFHFDEIIFDDVHNYENTSTEAKIDKVYSFIFDIESVLDPPYIDIELVTALKSVLDFNFYKAARWAISGGRQTVLGTRWDEQDYYGYILENAEPLGFEHWQRSLYKNGVDLADGYLWPEKWNKELEGQTRAQLEKRHGAAGLRRYYSQYHNKIVSPEDGVFEWDKLKYIHPDNYKLCEDGWVEVYSHGHELVAEFKPSLILDPTSTGNDTSDFCAMAVGGKTSDGSIYVCDWWMKRETPRVWLDKMWELMDKWRLYVAHIEMVGGFKVLEYTIVQQFMTDRSKRPISVKPWPTNSGAGAIAKEERIETTLAPLVYNELLHLPLSCSRDQELRKQFMFFGKGTTKDDGLDVLAALYEICIAQVRKQNHQPKQSVFDNNVIQMFGGVNYELDGTYGGVTYG